MANKLYEESSIQNIADAIRTKTGSTETYTVSEMAAAVSEIDTSGSGVGVDTAIVSVEASGFTLNEDTGRYEQTISVENMTAGSGGTYDIVRSGEVLTQAESDIMASITDVQREDGAIKIVCQEVPEQDYTLRLYGLASVQSLIGRVETLENSVDELNSKTVELEASQEEQNATIDSKLSNLGSIKGFKWGDGNQLLAVLSNGAELIISYSWA